MTPVTTKSFIPNVLTKKPIPKKVSKSTDVTSIPTKCKEIETKEEKDSDDDDIEIPETFDEEMWKKVCGRKSKPKPVIKNENVILKEFEVKSSNEIIIAPEPIKPYDGLDNQGVSNKYLFMMCNLFYINVIIVCFFFLV